MRQSLRTFTILFSLMFVASLGLSSCRVLMGDPRKNCNHPKHGEYMMEQRAKNMRKLGRR